MEFLGVMKLNRNTGTARAAKQRNSDKYYELVMERLNNELPNFMEMSLGELAEDLDVMNIKQPKQYQSDPTSLNFESHKIRQAQQKGWTKTQASRVKQKLNGLLEERHHDSD